MRAYAVALVRMLTLISAACSSSGRMRATAAGDGGSVGWACPALYPHEVMVRVKR